MIRMGRSSKPEQVNETPTFQQEQTSSTASLYQFKSENAPTANRALSDSETLSRDIKEGRLSGFVGYGTTLNGETNFQAMLRVDGHLTGRVTSEDGTLIVGSNGKVDANIMVASATINGTVNGDIVASEKIELGRTARVVGNIQSPRLIMEDGAILEGSCSMIKAKENAEKRLTEAKASYVQSEPEMYELTETAVEEEEEEEAEAAAS